MNRQRLGELADHIENVVPRGQFTMHLFCSGSQLDPDRSCGTHACIAGWAVAMWGKRPVAYALIPTVAKELLDLTCDDADWLFYGKWNRREAVNILRNLASGGSPQYT